MKVSVIVPVYNKESYLPECIDSLCAQTHRDIQIVLVDDESTDRSGEICDDYAARDDRIVVLHAQGEGPAAACRTGMEVADGEYVCFVDSDDWVDADMVERLAEHTTGRDDELILSDYVIERTDGTRTYVYQDITPGEYDADAILTEVFPRLWGLEDRAVSQSRCMKLYSHALAARNITYPDPDLKFAEDGAFLLPCVMDAGRMFFLDRAAMYHYRYVTDSAVHRYNPTVTDDIVRVRGIIDRAITDKFPDRPEIADRLRAMYRAESVILLMYAVKNELRGDARTCADRITALCKSPENASVIKNEPVRFRHPINRMIYHTMKHPRRIWCRLLKLMMDMHA